jgi:Carboxypeptidase regulatory-like domain
MSHRFRRVLSSAAVLVILGISSRPARAQAPPAALDAVLTRSGVALPGATLTFISGGGTVSVQSDDRGAVTLPLEAGEYTLEVQAPGSPLVSLPAFRVHPGERYRLSLDLAALADSVAKPAVLQGALVRVDPATRYDLDDRWLTRLPIDRRDALLATAELFPGLADAVALGAGAGSVPRVDGIDLTDPIDGSALTSHTATAAQSVAVAESGVSAAEPGFSGVVIDVVTRAGGNALSGLFDVRGTADGLRGDNTPEDLLTANPLLADRDRLLSDTDISGWMGGPLRRDRAFVSASFGYTRTEEDPEGPRTTRETSTPRAQARLTLAPSPSSTIASAFFFDDRATTGSAPADVARVTTDALANRVDARTIATRLVWQRALGRQMALRAGWSFLDGARRTEPESLVPGRVDEATNTYSGSLGLVDSRDRQRHAVNATLSTVLHAAGTHSLEAGGEFETARVEESSGFVDDRFYVDFGGRPNLEIDWAGAAREGRSRRVSGHVRDAWILGARVTVDAGVRFDALRGSSADSGAVYTATIVQPRVGAAIAVDGRGRTVVRVSYGQYAQPLWFSHYDRAVPGVAPIVSYEVLPSGVRREVERLVTPVYEVKADVRHPRVDETAVGLTQRLGASLTLGVSGVFRNARDFVDAVFPDARWIPVTRPGLPGTTITVYRWANRVASEGHAVIGNVDGVPYLTTAGAIIDTASATRDYRGLVASGRYDGPEDRFSVWGAWTWAQIDGTVDDTFAASISRSARFQSPSASLVNVDGEATHTPTQKVTLLATSRVPWIGARVSAVYTGRTGRRYAAVRQFGNETLDFPQSEQGRQVLLEERGARTLAADHVVDLRGEYTLKLGARQTVTIYVDAMNVLNRADVLGVSTMYPFASAGGAGLVSFEMPTFVRAPRQIYFGGRWAF